MRAEMECKKILKIHFLAGVETAFLPVGRTGIVFAGWKGICGGFLCPLVYSGDGFGCQSGYRCGRNSFGRLY